MGKCDKSRSIAIGFLTALVMGLVLLLWFGLDIIKKTMITRMDLLLFFLVLWVIGSSMDYYNQCFTKCSSVISSVKYGVFVVALIYLLFVVFVGTIDINIKNIFAFLVNIVIISGLHYISCDITHKNN
jgi:hypothetical protein